MDRPVTSNGNGDGKDFRDNGDHLKPSDTEERGLSTLNTDIEVRNGNTKPKALDNYVNANSDENNLMELPEMEGEADAPNDATDGRPSRIRKPATYTAKKTVAQGLIDLALLTSNANQLKNLLQYQNNGEIPFFINLFLIVLSLILQITVGVFLIFKDRFARKDRKNTAAAARVNNQIMAAVFLITVINIFIVAFGMSPPADTKSQNKITS